VGFIKEKLVIIFISIDYVISLIDSTSFNLLLPRFIKSKIILIFICRCHSKLVYRG
jgi:hypothetical protein